MKESPQYISPHNGQPLHREGNYLMTDGELSWPVLDGIIYLREKHELREEAVNHLRNEDTTSALKVLLRDQDDFAPLPPPDHDALDIILKEKSGFLETMRLLNYGPVTEYFAHRTTAPTFLSGLALLEIGALKSKPVIEIACGAGHYLRSLEANGFKTLGVDLVFSKLWLARNFMNVKGPLICADISASLFSKPDREATVFCHDAFYFFKAKEAILKNLRALSHGGSLVMGHVHTNAIDHGVSGHPISETDYREMAVPGSAFYSDEELVNYWLKSGENRSISTQQKGDNPVVSWIENSPEMQDLSLNSYAGTLHLNPMLEEESGKLHLQWPTEGYRKEYENEMPYLNKKICDTMDPLLVDNASQEEQFKLFKQRILLDSPAL